MENTLREGKGKGLDTTGTLRLARLADVTLEAVVPRNLLTQRVSPRAAAQVRGQRARADHHQRHFQLHQLNIVLGGRDLNASASRSLGSTLS